MEKQDYINLMDKLRNHNESILAEPITNLVDFYTKLCEEDETGELIEIYTYCKLRPDAFYGFIRYKSGEITLAEFENKIIPIINKEE